MTGSWLQRVWPKRLGFAATLTLTCAGCPEKDTGVKLVPLSGTVEKIERTSDESGRLTISYFSEKHGQEVTGIGEVTGTTEIMINGAAASFADIVEGDRVRGEVRVEKRGDKRIQTAVKIHVDRAKPVGE